MVVVSIITKISQLVVAYSAIWCGLFRIYICGIKFFGCANCFVYAMATYDNGFPQAIYHIVIGAYEVRLVSNKISSL